MLFNMGAGDKPETYRLSEFNINSEIRGKKMKGKNLRSFGRAKAE